MTQEQTPAQTIPEPPIPACRIMPVMRSAKRQTERCFFVEMRGSVSKPAVVKRSIAVCPERGGMAGVSPILALVMNVLSQKMTACVQQMSVRNKIRPYWDALIRVVGPRFVGVPHRIVVGTPTCSSVHHRSNRWVRRWRAKWRGRRGGDTSGLAFPRPRKEVR